MWEYCEVTVSDDEQHLDEFVELRRSGWKLVGVRPRRTPAGTVPRVVLRREVSRQPADGGPTAS
ncbi:MAG: hypothetical protein JOZ39_11195 [Chloroflexi bacterium]|nr:hypothetical protein [Chloroflexota bacterium]